MLLELTKEEVSWIKGGVLDLLESTRQGILATDDCRLGLLREPLGMFDLPESTCLLLQSLGEKLHLFEICFSEEDVEGEE